MELITAQEALRRTVAVEEFKKSLIENWSERFNESVIQAAEGDDQHPGETFMYFHMSVANELALAARDEFLTKVRAANFVVLLMDSNDDNDHFVYRIQWTAK